MLPVKFKHKQPPPLHLGQGAAPTQALGREQPPTAHLTTGLLLLLPHRTGHLSPES